MNRRPNPQKEVGTWNARVKVGDTVQYEEVKGVTEAQTFTTKTEAEVLSGHTAVVWLEGKRGCVAVSHCTPVPA
ncbi:MAG TPA: hypothetical protein DDZ58_08505 [Achromobacter sp.]|nr:hypothetical protein [Achromobacter sp.]